MANNTSQRQKGKYERILHCFIKKRGGGVVKFEKRFILTTIILAFKPFL